MLEADVIYQREYLPATSQLHCYVIHVIHDALDNDAGYFHYDLGVVIHSVPVTAI